MVVAEIDADGIAGEHHQIPRHERLLAGFILCRPRPGYSRHHTRQRIVPANPMRLGIGDVHHIVGIEGDRGRPGEIRLKGWTISIEPMLPCADDRGDDAGLMVYLPDAVAAGVADIEVVAGVKRDIKRQIETGLPTEPFVAAITGFAGTGEIMKGAFPEINPPDTI